MLLSLLALLLLGYGALGAALFVLQRRMLYPAPPDVREPRLPPGAALERIPGPGGAPVLAFHLPAPAGAPTVVHFHGNGEQLADVVGLAQAFRAAGLGFFAPEYPGYGLARGQETTEESIHAAAQAALEHLVGRGGVSRERLVLQGQSLGSGPAVEMAARGHGVRLVLVSPFTSVPDVAAGLFPFLPVRVLARDRFDSAARAPSLRVPVLVVHGTRDEVIPFALGERLGRLFPSARLLRVDGAGHNDVLDRPGVLEALVRFAAGEG